MTVFSCPGADQNTCQNPLQITRPNGLTFNLSWNQWRQCLTTPPPGETCSDFQLFQRLKSVTSSAGYSLTITYASDTPTGLFQSSAPPSSWFQRNSIAFGNSANPPSPAPTITYAYPSSTEVDATDPAGRKWVFRLDTSGRIIGVQRPGSASNNISYVYGADGTVSSSTKDGVTNSYSRSVAGTTATETRTDPLTHQRVVTADTGIGRPTSDRNELGNTTSYAYDANARLTQITAPEGNAVQYGYDPRGNVTTTTYVAKPGSGIANVVTTASFDATCGNIVKCNKPNSTTDAKGNVTTYAYDPTHGGVTSITQPAPTAGAVQPQTRLSYTQVTSASGNLVYMLTGVSACQTHASCTGTADETKVVAAYNSNLLPTSITRENGTATLAATSAMTYDARGNLLTLDGPLSGTADTTALKYDLADQLTGEISPDPDGAGALPNRAIRLTYRPDGQVSKKELGTTAGQSDTAFSAMTVNQTVDVTFDANSRPVQQKLSAGGTAYALTQTDYDSLGRLNCTAVRMNAAVYGSLPSSACTLSTQGSFGPDQISQNVYDNAGELTDVKVAVGTADAATERHMTYTANGLLSSLLDGENNLTAYVHDGFDRLSQTFYPNPNKGVADSNGADNELLTYDANGNVTQRRVRSGAIIGYAYDNLNRMTHKGGSTIADRDYTYDNFGRMLTAKFSTAGTGVTNAYDALGRLTSSTNNVSGTAQTFSYGYDLAGRRTSVSYPPAAGAPNLTATYNYLTTGEVSSMFDGATALASYAYDNLGNRASVTYGNGVVQSYGHDPVSRLSNLTSDLAGTTYDLTKTFSYSPSSQIASRTSSNDAYAWNGAANVNRPYTINGLNQYSAAGSASFSYDTNGNLASDGTNTFGYDIENELTSATEPGKSVTLSYDPLNRLWKIAGGGIGDISFVTDTTEGGAIAAEYVVSTGALNHRYVFGPGVDEPIVEYDGAGNRTWLIADERGSIVARSDAGGNLATVNSYDEYGIPASGNAGRYQYTGQAYLYELGLDYYKARFYSPTAGRFMQTDPIGQADNANLYAYVHNDPVNMVDPLGLTTELPCTHDNDPTCGIIINGKRIQDQVDPCDFDPGQCDPVMALLEDPLFTDIQIASRGSGFIVPTQKTKPPCGGAGQQFPVPPGFHSIFDPTGRMIARDGSNTPVMNPAYQTVVNSTHINWRGIFQTFNVLIGRIAKAVTVSSLEDLIVPTTAQDSVDAAQGANDAADAAKETNQELNSHTCGTST